MFKILLSFDKFNLLFEVSVPLKDTKNNAKVISIKLDIVFLNNIFNILIFLYLDNTFIYLYYYRLFYEKIKALFIDYVDNLNY